MHVALADLGLAGIDVVHAGTGTVPMALNVRAVALADVLHEVPPLGSG
jgi:hypothetical protein